MTDYLIVREEDDRLVRRGAKDDDEAERILGAQSLRHRGALLLFRDARLMAHATDGVVTSYREKPARREVAA